MARSALISLLNKMWPDGIPRGDFEKASILIRETDPMAPVARTIPTNAPKTEKPVKQRRPVGRPRKERVVEEDVVRTPAQPPLRVRVEELLEKHPEGLPVIQISAMLKAPVPSVYGVLRGVADHGSNGLWLPKQRPAASAGAPPVGADLHPMLQEEADQ